MKREFIMLGVVVMLAAFMYACAGVVYVPDPPPKPKSEIKPPAPHAKAVWIDGHWKWNGHKYIWVKGHWDKKPKGKSKWVPGHWKKTKRGHKWTPGHWKK